MNRRELIKQIALLTGGIVIGSEVFLSGCKQPGKTGLLLSENELALLDELGETIIPATDTPGAKAANIGAFMQSIVGDCYTKEEQDAFMRGLKGIDATCKSVIGKSFLESSAEERMRFVVHLEKEAKPFNENVKTKNTEGDKQAKEKGSTFIPEPPHYYTMMKQLTLWGFFTSKTGMTETLRHVAVPGRYDGSAPYTAGEKAWAGD